MNHIDGGMSKRENTFALHFESCCLYTSAIRLRKARQVKSTAKFALGVGRGVATAASAFFPFAAKQRLGGHLFSVYDCVQILLCHARSDLSKALPLGRRPPLSLSWPEAEAIGPGDLMAPNVHLRLHNRRAANGFCWVDSPAACVAVSLLLVVAAATSSGWTPESCDGPPGVAVAHAAALTRLHRYIVPTEQQQAVVGASKAHFKENGSVFAGTDASGRQVQLMMVPYNVRQERRCRERDTDPGRWRDLTASRWDRPIRPSSARPIADSDLSRAARMEVELLRALRHPHIQRLAAIDFPNDCADASAASEDVLVYAAQPLAQPALLPSTLAQLSTSPLPQPEPMVPESTVRALIQQIGSALLYLAELGLNVRGVRLQPDDIGVRVAQLSTTATEMALKPRFLLTRLRRAVPTPGEPGECRSQFAYHAIRQRDEHDVGARAVRRVTTRFHDDGDDVAFSVFHSAGIRPYGRLASSRDGPGWGLCGNHPAGELTVSSSGASLTYPSALQDLGTAAFVMMTGGKQLPPVTSDAEYGAMMAALPEHYSFGLRLAVQRMVDARKDGDGSLATPRISLTEVFSALEMSYIAGHAPWSPDAEELDLVCSVNADCIACTASGECEWYEPPTAPLTSAAADSTQRAEGGAGNAATSGGGSTTAHRVDLPKANVTEAMEALGSQAARAGVCRIINAQARPHWQRARHSSAGATIGLPITQPGQCPANAPRRFPQTGSSSLSSVASFVQSTSKQREPASESVGVTVDAKVTVEASAEAETEVASEARANAQLAQALHRDGAALSRSNGFDVVARLHAWVTANAATARRVTHVSLQPQAGASPGSIDYNISHLGQLTAAVLALPRLQRLNLRGLKLGDDAATALAHGLAAGPSTHLRHLDVHATAIGSRGAAALATALALMPQLQHLDVSNNALWLGGATALAKALASESELQSLDVSNNALGADGVAALTNACPRLKSLRTLRAGGNCHLAAESTGSCIAAVARMLTQLPQLEELDLSNLWKHDSDSGSEANALLLLRGLSVSPEPLGGSGRGSSASAATPGSGKSESAAKLSSELRHDNRATTGTSESAATRVFSGGGLPPVLLGGARYADLSGSTARYTFVGGSQRSQWHSDSLLSDQPASGGAVSLIQLGGAVDLPVGSSHVSTVSDSELGSTGTVPSPISGTLRGEAGATANSDSESPHLGSKPLTQSRHGRLRALAIAHWPLRSTSARQALAALVNSSPLLQDLNIAHCGIGDVGAELLAQVNHSRGKAVSALARQQLRKLVLAHNGIGSGGMRAVINAVKAAGAHAVEHLDLAGNSMHGDGINAVVDALKHMPRLQHLDLGDSGINFDDLRAVTLALQQVSRLRFLSLANVDSKPDSEERAAGGALLSGLLFTPHLETLYWSPHTGQSWNNGDDTSDPTARALASLLSSGGLVRLKFMWLNHRDCRFSRDAQEQLSGALQHAPALQRIEMKACRDYSSWTGSKGAVSLIPAHITHDMELPPAPAPTPASESQKSKPSERTSGSNSAPESHPVRLQPMRGGGDVQIAPGYVRAAASGA